MRNTYLIDFENVGSEGLNGVSSLTSDDRVILFYSTNSNRMTVRAHQAIVASPAKFDYFEVAVGGKNALDHQLGTYLGYMIATNASERYFIVSHDNGFKFLSTFWLSQNANLQISMTDTIKASLRIRSSERARSASKSEFKLPFPASVEPVKTLSPVETMPAESKPVLVEMPIAPSDPAVAEVSTPEVQPLVEPAPILEVPPEASVGPLPALGSQSRSRSNPQRSRVRSDSILATLRPAKPVEDLRDDRDDLKSAPEIPQVSDLPTPETDFSEEVTAEPENLSIAAESALTIEVPATTSMERADLPEISESAEPVAESAYGTTENPAESVRNARSRRRRTRSNRKDKELKAADSESKEFKSDSEKDNEAPSEPAETVTAVENDVEPAKPEIGNQESTPTKSELSKAGSTSQNQKTSRSVKTESGEAKPYVLSETASTALSALLQEHPKVNESRVRELIAASKKQLLCNTLRRQLGQEQGLALYNQVKKLAWK